MDKRTESVTIKFTPEEAAVLALIALCEEKTVSAVVRQGAAMLVADLERRHLSLRRIFEQ